MNHCQPRAIIHKMLYSVHYLIIILFLSSIKALKCRQEYYATKCLPPRLVNDLLYTIPSELISNSTTQPASEPACNTHGHTRYRHGHKVTIQLAHYTFQPDATHNKKNSCTNEQICERNGLKCHRQSAKNRA